MLHTWVGKVGLAESPRQSGQGSATCAIGLADTGNLPEINPLMLRSECDSDRMKVDRGGYPFAQCVHSRWGVAVNRLLFRFRSDS